MKSLTVENIVAIAESPSIYTKGESLFRKGAFRLLEADEAKGVYRYEVEGSYGDYQTIIQLGDPFDVTCDCPYPGAGCKHVIAALHHRFEQQQMDTVNVSVGEESFLTGGEIRTQALEDRRKRAAREEFRVKTGDMFKGDHLIETPKGRQYQVTLHDPGLGAGHCSCPDYQVNRLGTCKHILYLVDYLKEKKWYEQQLARERFPYIDIFWDGSASRPRLFHERPASVNNRLRTIFEELFDEHGFLRDPDLIHFVPYLEKLENEKFVRIQESVMRKVEQAVLDSELLQAEQEPLPDLSHLLKLQPYHYQEEGVRFCLYKKGSLIGDEMGLGKTLQAIILAILKKEIFGFNKVLIVTLASLKDQWKREIERFSYEQAHIISGNSENREQGYENAESLFKISNYEAVLRDVEIISRYKPDLVILDEAQRIKNFETKTADAVKRLPRQHALVLTGTPLENKLEDVYSIVQFLDPELLSPLWQFAANHFLLSRTKKNKILGYRQLDKLREKLRPIVVRRRKEEVLDELPEQVRNDYFIDMHPEQALIHADYSRSLLPLMNKKFLTPMDLRHIQMLLLKMRQVCDSTHLIDRETDISPKLNELASILDELVVENKRKVVIFSEWRTMTALIGKHLSRVGIPFVELSGKVPVAKRQLLIDEFSENPDCKVFLSTDAGGTGLNLQAADSVINFEIPWSPARLNQRIGRVNRLGQKSGCINIINLISRNSIEERILAGNRLKSELFDSVFDGGSSEVIFDRGKRQEMVGKLREVIEAELQSTPVEAEPAAELTDDMPHFLNKKALENEPLVDDYFGEEEDVPAAAGTQELPRSAEQMEEVLNQGMTFLSGLLEVATGKKMESTDASGKMISLDKNTGEVTMKFKLPGFE
ncbi:SNF2-related protein [Desulfopila sp. IMCC35008]|uniref:SNF2-related protein n=1 Tax=Desulfopila sp. IMCC35008 TaxID=2653858 RepID=UPI0013D32A60|nr:SNF2-related protein [Desulfopila sp. IMCC35008]